MTNSSGAVANRHEFWPYGEEITSQASGQQMKFTGHERDLGVLVDASGAPAIGDDLDYMHARYYSPLRGSFLSVDKHPGAPKQPQSWNRYLYARDNPLKYVDPNGQTIALATGGNVAKLRSILVSMAMRPTGRGALSELAAKADYKVTFKEQRLQQSIEAEKQLRTQGHAQFVGGETARDQGGKGATVVIDTKTVEAHHPDSSGRTTAGHETYHAMGMAGGFSDTVLVQGHDPSNKTGPAEQFGELVSQEQPDMSKQEAEQLLQQWLDDNDDASQQPPN